MNSKVSIFFSLIVILGLFSCKKNKYSDTPELEFLSISKQYLKQNGKDSMVMTFSYVDGDGDIGSNVSDNIFIYDNRNSSLFASYRFPNDADLEDGQFRKGELQLIVYSACCKYTDGTADCITNPNQSLDTVVYEIEVVDQSGKTSNRIQSDPVFLECE